MSIKNFRDLIVWQKAMDIVTEIYCLTKKFPKDEMYGLTNQMRRASVSIPSNIAEGQSRNSTKEFIQFLSIAQGSKSELETQLLLSVRLQYLSNDETVQVFEQLSEVSKMITGLMQKLDTAH